jgi:hypothetical protein
MSGVSKPHSELYSPVRNDLAKFHLRWRFALKIGAVHNWLKTQPKNFLFLRNLKKCETLEPVRWSRGGITLKSDISFVFVYLQ